VSDSVPPPGFTPPPSDGEPVPVTEPAPASARRSPRFSRRSLIAAAVGLTAAVIAVFLALGSSSNPTADPIAEAATVSAHAPGYQMHMSLSLTSSAFGGAITGYGDAVVDPRDHAVSTSFSIDLSSIPQVAQVLGDSTMTIDMIEDGHTVYMKLPQMLLGKVPGLGSKPWLEMNVAKMSGIPGLSSLGADPTTTDPGQMLQYLRAASDAITNEGQQQVNGVQTTHYHAELSLDRLTAGIPAAEEPAVQQALSKLRQALGGSDLPVDVWVDAHQLVRRTAMSLSMHPSGGATLQETVVADVTKYGPQPRPALPPADQVQDATSLLSGGGLAG
jgi:hypothetical protein